MENKEKFTAAFNYNGEFGDVRKGKLNTSQFREKQNPELVEKFYKQIVNSFGYAYSAKL
jgi:hypothetical protein